MFVMVQGGRARGCRYNDLIISVRLFAMPATLFPARFALAFAGCAMLAACSSFDGVSNRIAGSITPYKVEVVQGNFVSREQVEALKPGMSRQQVRDLLGTPLVTSLFHGDRWDYVFTLRRQGVEPQQRRLTVFFEGETLARFEGDTMPSESEFVATLDKKGKGGKVPPLEATEEQLRRYASTPSAAPSAPAPSGPLPSYPPLEPAAR
jgi:outer membrane protein assembly factor BamE